MDFSMAKILLAIAVLLSGCSAASDHETATEMWSKGWGHDGAVIVMDYNETEVQDNKVSKPLYPSTQTVLTNGATLRVYNGGNRLEYPGNGYNYGHNLDLVWNVRAPSRQVMMMTVVRLDLEGHTSCAYDYLKITGLVVQSPVTFCGTMSSNEQCSLVSRSNSVRVQFHTDAGVNGLGFQLDFQPFVMGTASASCRRLDASNVCSVVAPTALRGTITSPNYPSSYGNWGHCRWTLQAGGGGAVRLSINSLSLEQSSTCDYDYLRIIDSTAGIEENLCGALPAGQHCTFVSRGPILELVFRSDASVTSTGFSLTFEKMSRLTNEITSCPSFLDYSCPSVTLTAASGSITSPDFPSIYPNRATCTWTITVAPRKQISLHVKMLALEECTGCTCDSLVIFGLSGQRTRSVRLCGDQYNKYYRSSGNSLTLLFSSDRYTQGGPGFSLDYTSVDRGSSLPDSTVLTHREYACGAQPSLYASVKVIGGQHVSPHEWPWMMGMHLNGRLFCSATILSRTWALTAAHCVQLRAQQVDQIVLIAGDHTQDHYDGPEQTAKISRTYVHPNYNADRNDKDIALLRLREPLTFSEHVRPVCVASSDLLLSSTCYATGWGWIEYDPLDALLGTNRSSSRTMREVRLPLVARRDCYPEWGPHFVTDGMLCAGHSEGGKGTCKGDSGGPLVCLRNGVWVEAGVTSWAIGCAQANSPGVYTKASYFASWINATTGGEAKFG